MRFMSISLSAARFMTNLDFGNRIEDKSTYFMKYNDVILGCGVYKFLISVSLYAEYCKIHAPSLVYFARFNSNRSTLLLFPTAHNARTE